MRTWLVAFVLMLTACSGGPSPSQLRAEGQARLAQATALAEDANTAARMATDQARVLPTATPWPTPTLVPTPLPTPVPTLVPTLAPAVTPVPTTEPKVITQIVVLTATPAAPLFTRDEQRRFVLTGVLIVVLLVVGAGMIGLVLFATRKMFGGRVFFLPSEPSEPSQPNRRRSKKP